jgi:uncharacterized protein
VQRPGASLLVHRGISADLAADAKWKGVSAMKILVTGSSGLIGRALASFLAAAGHQVACMVRGNQSGAQSLVWDPDAGRIDPALLEGFDAVVHLAGENIAGARWTREQKARIRNSRVKGTRLLAETLAGLSSPPQVMVSVSAIGYYGDRGEEMLTEESPPGEGYLSEVCREWEAATQSASKKGIRVVIPRIGIVLTPAGGALARMLPPFQAGVGGVVGSGRQYMSWLALDDVVGAIHHAIVSDSLRGPVNAVAPRPVTNREFTKTLGRVLGRPTLFPAPAFALRLAFGEMADALLLASARVSSGRLESSGYKFRQPDLEAALRHLLGRTV